ncbi:MAG: hypothetical protein J6Y47_03700 [Bacteroidales bacterium]|nr:hypothetical protein [Bacteroidales bacterium]
MKKSLSKIFEAFNGKNILVIGDVMLDEYIEGKVNRLSPEAPVPIVDITSRYTRLGGAANVALNIKALGGNPILCSVIGAGDKSKCFLQLLENQQMPTQGVIKSTNRCMTVKYRVLGNNTQLLRMDEEIKHSLADEDDALLIQQITAMINNGMVDGIVFEDYDKGIISPLLIDRVVKLAVEHHIPVSVDPKKKNFLSYHHVDVFKPNWKEMKEGLNLTADKPDEESLNKIKQMMREHHFSMVVLTLSEDGVLLLYRRNDTIEDIHIPTRARQVADVSGAGDTMIAVAALALIVGVTPKEMVQLANLAGGMVCEHVGVVPINKQLFFEEAVKYW